MNIQPSVTERPTDALWLGTLPDRWQELRGKRIFNQIRAPKKPGDEQLSATQKYGVVPQSKFMEQEGSRVVLALSGTENFRHVDKDDFVISLRSFQGGIERCHFEGCVSPAYTILKKSRPISESFFSYLLKCDWFIAALQIGVTGIREGKNVSYEDFGDIILPFPELGEQTAIANFLDRETVRIDGLIEKKGRFIELLKEKRVALISHAVTKGIDADVVMKPSAIDWIGHVPDTWQVTKLGYLGRSANGINIGGDAFGSGFPFISYGDVYKNRQLPKKIGGLVQSSKEDRRSYSVKAGDILFTRTSETVEEVAFPSVAMSTVDEAVFAGFLIRFRPYPMTLVPLFSKYAFQNSGLRNFFAREMKIVTRASLSQGLLQSMPIALPPLAEQARIGAYLETMNTKFERLITHTNRSIELLKEKRSALITAAVTGNIDVRNAA